MVVRVAVSATYGETECLYPFRNTSLSFEDRVKVRICIIAKNFSCLHGDVLGFSWSTNVG